MTARNHLVSIWIAIAAILLNALVPTVSLAFGPAQKRITSASSDWIEICSSLGSSWVKLDLGGQVLAQTTQKPLGSPEASHGGHCPYCLTHAASFGLPPAPKVAVPLWSQVAALLPQRAAHGLSPRLWRAPAARAPPAKTKALFARTAQTWYLPRCLSLLGAFA